MTDPGTSPVVWSARRADDETVVLAAAIEPGWHIYAARPSPPAPGEDPMAAMSAGPAPTIVTSGGGGPVTRVDEPEPHERFDAGFGRVVLVHEGTVELRIRSAANRLVVAFQACSGSTCLPPENADVPVEPAAGATSV